MQRLTSFLQTRADAQHDGRIPEPTKTWIASVARAERDMALQIGPIETARQTLVGAYTEFGDAYGRFSAFESMAARYPTDGLIREELARARSDLLGSLEWLADCRLKMSTAIRQAASDAAQSAGAPAGAAA